jgi:hypothetical protein
MPHLNGSHRRKKYLVLKTEEKPDTVLLYEHEDVNSLKTYGNILITSPIKILGINITINFVFFAR